MRSGIVEHQRGGPACGLLGCELRGLFGGERFTQPLGPTLELDYAQHGVGKALLAQRLETGSARFDQYFGRVQSNELSDPLRADLDDAGAKRAGGELERGDPPISRCCNQKIFSARIECVRLEAKPRSDHTHDLSRN
ncbi:MAG: hypothetical protein JRF54_14885, partial [Deltaproteobacteria bacterium]|nr:hypothetical protein [Deltaproteobacteria bacterium]